MKMQERVVLVTHPIRKEDKLTSTLQKEEVKVISLPLIFTEPISFQMNHSSVYYDWVVFTSRNAVSSFFTLMNKGSFKIASMGIGTDEAVRKMGYISDFIGSGKSATHFSDELKYIIPHNSSVLLALGDWASPVMEERLSQSYRVERVNVYRTFRTKRLSSDALKIISNDSYDLITVTSPSAVRHLMDVLPSRSHLRLASIGVVTTETIQSYGFSPVVEANVQSYEGLSQVVLEWLKKRS